MVMIQATTGSDLGSYEHLRVDFVYTERTQAGVLAGSGNAFAGGGFENGAVVGADQTVVVVGQEAVGGEVERAALVGTQIEPDERAPLVTGCDQPDRLALVLDLKLTIPALVQFV
jgi:hypothetical protein